MDEILIGHHAAVDAREQAASSEASVARPWPSWAFPLLLSCLAGASTCVGAAVVFCFRPSTIRKSMAFSLSLAAAVMVTISVVSILPEVAEGILEQAPVEGDTLRGDFYDMAFATSGGTTTVLRTKLLLERLASLGIGVAAYLLLARLLVFLPDPEHMYLLDDPGETEDHKRNYDLYLSCSEDEDDEEDFVLGGGNQQSSGGNARHKAVTRRKPKAKPVSRQSSRDLDVMETEDFSAFARERRKRSWRVALMLFASLLIHNFPEGLCVAASAKESPELGITVAIGIFIHNVPEGIAISVPCIAARPDRPWLAFWLASFSGLAEPLGAAVALLMLGKTKLDLENVLAFVAGVMITVALWELYPEAVKAHREELQSRHPNSRLYSPEAPVPLRKLLVQLVTQPEYRPILWGTVVGALLMIATELYLP